MREFDVEDSGYDLVFFPCEHQTRCVLLPSSARYISEHFLPSACAHFLFGAHVKAGSETYVSSLFWLAFNKATSNFERFFVPSPLAAPYRRVYARMQLYIDFSNPSVYSRAGVFVWRQRCCHQRQIGAAQGDGSAESAGLRLIFLLYLILTRGSCQCLILCSFLRGGQQLPGFLILWGGTRVRPRCLSCSSFSGWDKNIPSYVPHCWRWQEKIKQVTGHLAGQ